jgi:ABC-2 type transport system ATP-binding protein
MSNIFQASGSPRKLALHLRRPGGGGPAEGLRCIIPDPMENRDASHGAAVEVRGLRHRYGDREALKGIDFTVGRGEIFGLLGPNGGGKTTLFRILSTLTVPTEGSAALFGRVLDHSPTQAALKEMRRRIGVVFQAFSLDKKLTVAENLRHQGHLYGLAGPELRRRIGELLERFRLTERTRDRVETLSGGLCRRVELAKGLLHRPDLLLLDEPATGLDPGARYDLWEYLEMLRKQDGVTVLATTHILEEAERCDRIGILSRGELVALDTPAALKATIGGDILSIETSAPEELARGIRERFGETATVVDASVRLERPEAHRFLPSLIESFAGQIAAVTVGKPTLEDVFIRLTGHRFWDEEADQNSGASASGRSH